MTADERSESGAERLKNIDLSAFAHVEPKKSWMTLKRAFLILLFAFAWLVGFIALGALVGSYVDEKIAGLCLGIALIGFMVWLLIGFAVWAGAKGYSPLLGAFLAWIGPLGMFILVFLPDKSARRSANSVVSKSQDQHRPYMPDTV